MKKLSGICRNGERDFIWLILTIFKGNMSASNPEVEEKEVLMTATEATEVIEEDSDLEVAVDSMTEEMAAIVTEVIVEITSKTDLVQEVLQDSMIDHQEGKYHIQINKVLLDLELHHNTTLPPEGADQDPEDKENAENALTQDLVASLESSTVTEEAETLATEERTEERTEEIWETKSTMAQDPTDQTVLSQEWERTVTRETSHQESQETCLQEVMVQEVMAQEVMVQAVIAMVVSETIADPQEAADSNPEVASETTAEVASETTADQEATSEAALVAETETKRKKEPWKRVSASFASSKATWPEIALKEASNVREAVVETEVGTSQDLMETMTESYLTDYYK
jgi:hypothetical protein